MLSLTVTAEHDAVDASPVAERWFWVGELQMAIEVTMELVTSGHGHPYFLLCLEKKEIWRCINRFGPFTSMTMMFH